MATTNATAQNGQNRRAQVTRFCHKSVKMRTVCDLKKRCSQNVSNPICFAIFTSTFLFCHFFLVKRFSIKYIYIIYNLDLDVLSHLDLILLYSHIIFHLDFDLCFSFYLFSSCFNLQWTFLDKWHILFLKKTIQNLCSCDMLICYFYLVIALFICLVMLDTVYIC